MIRFLIISKDIQIILLFVKKEELRIFHMNVKRIIIHYFSFS